MAIHANLNIHRIEDIDGFPSQDFSMTDYSFPCASALRFLAAAGVAFFAIANDLRPADAMSVKRMYDLHAHNWACTSKSAYAQHRRRLSSGRVRTELVGGKAVLVDVRAGKVLPSPDCVPLLGKTARVVERTMFAGQWCVTTERHGRCLWIDKAKFRRLYAGAADGDVYRRISIRVVNPRRTR
ncbi:hypothetical protein LC092_00440 [Stappia stellulata]|uniref:hypothetical protein n=2 Tax=Stappia TaxID=152161 RepID=UPI001CD32643|nr:hypothetical protein [Stappia stellulata]MCA1240896.1 hypothetical protein [Stappia stellulata]